MKVDDFTKSRISCDAQEIPFVFNWRKIYSIRWLTALIVSILFPLHALFAQDPTLSGIEAIALDYDEGQSPTQITGTIMVSDADSPMLTSATIQITGNYLSAEDKLLFTDAFMITGSYDPLSGTLTLTGPASPADFTSALRSVTYQNTNNNNPSNLVRTLSFVVNDGVSNSVTVTRNIQVNRVNDAPTGNPDNFVMNEDTELDCGCLPINDIDPDGDDLIVLPGQLPANGTVSDLGGFFIYIPNPNFYGTDSFTYYANDGSLNSNETLVTVTVLPVNDAPIALNDGATTNEDSPIAIPILSNDIDVDDVLTASMIVIVNSPTQGTLDINITTGAVVYTPNLNFNGNDSFTYQVKDASGAISNVATVNLIINPVNDAPVANPDVVTTPEEVPISIAVLANDTDVDNALDPASLIIVTGPASGAAVVQSPTGLILYTPQKDFTGNDSFTYTLKDPGGATSAPATVTIAVSPVNDAPVANPDFVTTPEEVPISIAVLANDTDVDHTLGATALIIVSGPASGAAVVQSPTGLILYTPQKDFTGNDSFTYALKDPDGATSASTTVTIAVSPVNDSPVANPDFVTTPEEVPISIAVLANDTDVDHVLDAASLIIVTGPSSGAAVVQSPMGTILYTPQKDFTGNDSFTYALKDPGGATSAPTTVTITVSPVNDPPVAVNDEATTEKNTPVNINILINDYDVDNNLVPASVVITNNPVHGTVTFNASTGVVNFTPETNFLGDDSFAYTVQDAGGLTSSSATVSVTVIEAPNRAPHAVDDGPILNSLLSPITIDVLANDYDEDNSHDELSLVSVTNPSMGTVSIVNGKIVYQSGGLISETVTFTYTIQDPSGLTDVAVVTIENYYPPLTVSEGFSPNNDNNNETWFILGIENYPNNSVKVFDRWGFLVYQKQGYENLTAPWNGRGNSAQQSGKLLDQGTYYYILEPGGEMKTMTGYVVIVR